MHISSSDEEVFSRRHKRQKQSLENLFEEEMRYEEEDEYDDENDHVLMEVFGTGREYSYVNSLGRKVEEVVKEEERTEKLEEVLDTEAVAEWVTEDLNLPYEMVREAVNELIQNYHVNYIVLHESDNFNLKTMHRIRESLESYKKFLGLKEFRETGEGDELSLPSVNNLLGNLTREEKILGDSKSVDLNIYAQKIALSPDFRKFFENSLDSECVDYAMSSLFPVEERENIKIRKLIKEAFKMVNKRKESKKDEDLDKLFSFVVDTILNGGCSKGYVYGMYDSGAGVTICVLDDYCRVVEECFTKEASIKLAELVEKYPPAGIGISVGSRWLSQTSKSICQMGEYVNGDSARDIALFLAAPELFFRKYLGNISGNLQSILSEIGVVSFSVRNEREAVERLTVTGQVKQTIYRALLTGLSIVGVNLNKAINGVLYPLLEIIPGLSNESLERIKNYGWIERLDVLTRTEILTEEDFINASTFLRVSSAPDVQYDYLDDTLVHPLHYDTVRMVCAATLGKDEVDEDAPSAVVEEVMSDDKHMDALIEIVGTDKKLLTHIKFLCYKRRSRGRKTKDVLFRESISYENSRGKEETGTILSKKGDYFHIQLNTSTTPLNFPLKHKSMHKVCYAPANSINTINDTVQVRLEDENFEHFTYTGRILTPRNMQKTFEKIPIFQPISYQQAIATLDTTPLILIRTKDYGMLLLKVKEETLHFKVSESPLMFHCTTLSPSTFMPKVKKIYILCTEIKNHRKYTPLKNRENFLNKKQDHTPYSLSFSDKHHSTLIFTYFNTNKELKEIQLKITDKIIHKNREYNNIEEFIKYFKKRTK